MLKAIRGAVRSIPMRGSTHISRSERVFWCMRASPTARNDIPGSSRTGKELGNPALTILPTKLLNPGFEIPTFFHKLCYDISDVPNQWVRAGNDDTYTPCITWRAEYFRILGSSGTRRHACAFRHRFDLSFADLAAWKSGRTILRMGSC